MNINYLQFKSGGEYRITQLHDGSLVGWPCLGAVGICQWSSSIHGVCMNFGAGDLIVPFECLSPVDVKESKVEISDSILLKLIEEKPESVYKILRGLWRLNKHISVRNLMECGTFSDDTIIDTVEEKEADKKWDQGLADARNNMIESNVFFDRENHCGCY